jgi:hypothetical protein
MFTRNIPRYRPDEEELSTFPTTTSKEPSVNVNPLRLSGRNDVFRLFRRFKQWHDWFWGRSNEWDLSFGSFWELVMGLMSAFSQVISGLVYLYKLHNTPTFIQPMTGNSYLKLFAIVTMMHSPRLKSNMFSFIWTWLIILLTFLFQVLLNILPIVHGSYAPLFQFVSPHCVSASATCSAAIGETVTCATEAQLGQFVQNATIPWQFNCAYQVLLFGALVFGLVSYWAPEQHTVPGDIFRLSIIACLGITGVSSWLQAHQQLAGIQVDLLVCPNASNVTATAVVVDTSCVCSQFVNDFTPALADSIALDTAFSRFFYNII